MQLYRGSTSDFISDSVQHRVAEKLGDAYYEYYRFRASVSEFNSWQNSLTALTSQLQYSRLLDNGIILEMQLPLASKRLDALLTGQDERGRSNAVLIELKQWTQAQSSEIPECVTTYVGQRLRDLPHPSLQAANYKQYLSDMNSAFFEGEDIIKLEACTWLHNLDDKSYRDLTSDAFAELLARAPLFSGHDADRLQNYLARRLKGGNGTPILERVVGGRFAPSKGLMKHAAAVIKGEPTYTLLDDQIVAYNLILKLAQSGLRAKDKHAVAVIKGGPGTGKSVLALNVMAQLLKEGKNVQHATGSRAFTGNLRKKLGPRAGALLKYFNSFVAADEGQIDVLVMDEAHRIRLSSNSRFTRKDKRSSENQIDELINASKVSVFFIDDLQSVRPGEIGSSDFIRESAVRHEARYAETELTIQFRCAGSDQYLDWLDQLLEIRKTGVKQLEKDSDFDFRVVDSPQELEQLIREKSALGNSARIAAGFCWPWSDPLNDGTLVDDVRIGDFCRPWNAQPDAARLAKGIPKADVWATDPGGIDQIGCIYTAQGFEFDYAGVIFGSDLQYDAAARTWKGVPSASHDRIVRTRAGARFTDCVKNSYRVLMTRGMKGCYVYCVDPETAAIIRASM